MKKLILLTLLLIPLTILAQTEQKYLTGAITYNDEQKVDFSTTYKLPGMSKEDIYSTSLEWANQRYQPTEDMSARVLLSDPKKGIIAAGGEEYIVFKSNMFTLDRTRIYYHLIINCTEGECKVNMTRIRYWYDENRDGGEKYTAEEWINDKVALNKAKTKLAPVTGKFREKTIDLKDEIFKDMQTAFGNRLIAMGLKEAPKKAVDPTTLVGMETGKVVAVQAQAEVKQEAVQQQAQQQNVQQQTVAKQQTVRQQTVQAQTPVVTASIDTESLIKQATRITITAGNDEKFEITKDNWGGFGEIFGKKVAFCILDTQKAMGNMLLSQSNEYKISFYTAQNQQPILVIKCKKQMTQQLTGEEAQKMNSKNDASKSYNMYVGEVIK